MRRLLSSTALILASLALAAPLRAAEARLPVQVVVPAPGTELTPGALATVAWEAPDGALTGRRIHEWEAFLSLDGGRSWPLRLTPHLDVDIRRFTFRVPAFPTRDARLLLRFGDEREETEVDVPGSFTIAAGPDRFALGPLPPGLRLSRGESARPGQGGVILWTEGGRDGAGLHQVVARDVASSWRAVHAGGAPLLPLLWPAPGREDLLPPDMVELDQPVAGRERAPAATVAPRAAPETRVLIHRYNE
jgi:hypothetical protein